MKDFVAANQKAFSKAQIPKKKKKDRNTLKLIYQSEKHQS